MKNQKYICVIVLLIAIAGAIMYLSTGHDKIIAEAPTPAPSGLVAYWVTPFAEQGEKYAYAIFTIEALAQDAADRLNKVYPKLGAKVKMVIIHVEE